MISDLILRGTGAVLLFAIACLDVKNVTAGSLPFDTMSINRTLSDHIRSQAGDVAPGSKEQTPKMPPDPPAPETRDGGGRPIAMSPDGAAPVFGREELIRVQAFAAKHGIVIPLLKFDAMASTESAAGHPAIGVWLDELGGKSGRGRKHVIAVTGIDAGGHVAGVLAYGPPGVASFDQRPAGFYHFKGEAVGNTIQFNNPMKTVNVVLTIVDGKKMIYNYANQKGQRTSRDLRPIWRMHTKERQTAR